MAQQVDGKHLSSGLRIQLSCRSLLFQFSPQRLYNAILALPVHPYGDQCPTPSAPTYQFAFHTPQQTIPATIDPTCKTITLNGAYQTRGGTYTLNDQFNRLFAEIVAGANFAPAQPDKLTLTIQTLY
ncbi:MAG: hypothetical protein ACXVDA_24905, partial [Ktedonobacterales bacterium]